MTREKAIRIARRHLDASGLNMLGLYPAEWIIDAIMEAQEVEEFDGSWRIKNIGEDPVFDSICVNVAFLLGIKTNVDALWFGPNGRAVSENIAANIKTAEMMRSRTPVAWRRDATFKINDEQYPFVIVSGAKKPAPIMHNKILIDWQPLYAE